MVDKFPLLYFIGGSIACFRKKINKMDYMIWMIYLHISKIRITFKRIIPSNRQSGLYISQSSQVLSFPLRGFLEPTCLCFQD